MGMITAIQRFSLHDGPGIRTTVFLKGCNLACAWCHNPETLSPRPQLMLHMDKCIGCGACVAACPNGARKLGEKGIEYDRSLCTGCGRCTDVCFSGALELCGREVTAEDVMKEVRQDKAYYDHSGGGVTLSGGETMLQPEFALELVLACEKEGIRTAVETNLCYDFSRIRPLLEHLSLVMCDVKHADAEKHRHWTGASNRQILENLKNLDESGLPVIVRTPVIPGVNDNEDDIAAIAGILTGMKHLETYELLNFNPLGGSKYESLSIHDTFRNAKPLPGERMEQLAEAARKKGLTSVRIG